MSKISKGFHGWQAVTQIKLEDGYVLELFTMKRYSGLLVTTAGRKKLNNDGIGTSWIPSEDYSEVVCSEKVRVTQSAVKAQHEDALADVREIKDRMYAHYSNKAKELAVI